MISLDKAILLGVMRIAEKHCNAEGLTKTDKGSGEVTALGGSNRSSVSRSSVMEVGKPCSVKIWATDASAVSAVKSERTW